VVTNAVEPDAAGTRAMIQTGTESYRLAYTKAQAQQATAT
jgi:hypothetical protein